MRAILATAVVALVACGTSSTVQPRLQPRLEQPFTLGLDQTAEFPELSLTITFRSVPSDSRCPRTVVCVWEGNADVQLEVTVRGEVRRVGLNTALQPRDVVVGSQRLVLRALSPEPPLRAQDYQVTLELQPQ
jgi:hypothetical protein